MLRSLRIDSRTNSISRALRFVQRKILGARERLQHERVAALVRERCDLLTRSLR